MVSEDTISNFNTWNTDWLQLHEDWPIKYHYFPFHGVGVHDTEVRFEDMKYEPGQTSIPWGLTYKWLLLFITWSRCSWPQGLIPRNEILTGSDFSSMRTDPIIISIFHFMESVFMTPRSNSKTENTDAGWHLVSQELNGSYYLYFLTILQEIWYLLLKVWTWKP